MKLQSTNFSFSVVLARLGIGIRRVDTPASGSGRKRSRAALKATSLTNPKRSRIETSVAGSSSSIRRSRSPTVPSTPERAEPNSLQNAVLLYPEPEGEGNSGLTGEEQILKDNIKQEEIEKLDVCTLHAYCAVANYSAYLHSPEHHRRCN